MDSFGLLRWERFSTNPAVGTIVRVLAKPNVTFADLSSADAAVKRKPDDLPSRALRAELRLRVDPAASRLAAPTVAELVRLKKPDRFEASYLYYHRRRVEQPERYGITTGRDKANPPYAILRQNDLTTLEVSQGWNDVSWIERVLKTEFALRYGWIEVSRRNARQLVAQRADVWEFVALEAIAYRYGGRYVTPNSRVDPDWVARPADSLKLLRRLRTEHPECRVLDQVAGVAAMDLKKNDLARTYFRAYLADPDPGSQGERRSKDVRELLARLDKK